MMASIHEIVIARSSVLNMLTGLVVLLVTVRSDTILTEDYVTDISTLSEQGVHIARYEVLTVPSKCLITTCHRATQDAKNYHSYCFQSDCQYDEYHCVEGQEIIVHFCGKFDKCHPYDRHIPVFNKSDPGHVDIYKVPCEHGYFQRNEKHSCFSPCVKDISRGFYYQGEGVPQLAYCIPSKGCNPFGKMFFILETPDDDCSGISRCRENEDPLPDCTCGVKCLPGQTRLPSEEFKCSHSNDENLPTTTKFHDSTSTLIKKTSNEDDTKNDGKSPEEHNENIPEVTNEVEPNDQEEEPPSNNNYHIFTLAIVAIACVSLVAIVSWGGVYIHNRWYKDSGSDDRERRSLMTRSENAHIGQQTVGDETEDRAVEHADNEAEVESHMMDPLKGYPSVDSRMNSNETDLKTVISE
ncbi:hypothetical protein ACF0H5_005844 [Mactra antiquata]